MSWLRLHLFLASVCGLQMLLWLGSGLALSLIDESYLDSNRYRVTDNSMPTSAPRPFHPSAVTLPEPVTEISVYKVLSRPVYRLLLSNQVMNVWADTLEPLELTDEQLRQIAAASVSAPLSDRLKHLPGNAIGFPDSVTVAVFQAQTDRNTRVLIDATSGKLLAHKDKGSDLKELLLMLHFMDYAPGNGIGFNHLAIRIFALLTLVMAISGSVLVWQRWQAGYYRRTQKQQLLIVEDTQGTELGRFNAGPSLLETINQNGPKLPTQCGGGGSCGLCALVFIDSPPEATEADISRLRTKVDTGMRLACQHGNCGGRVRLANRAQERYWQKQQTNAEPIANENV